MEKIMHEMNKDDVLFLVKTAVSSKFAILKEDGYKLKVGAPMMTASIEIKDDCVEVDGGGAGKMVATTCISAIKQEIEREKRNKAQAAPQAVAAPQVAAAPATPVAESPKKAEPASNLDEEIKAAQLLKLVFNLNKDGILSDEEYDNKKTELIHKLNIKSLKDIKDSGKCPFCGFVIDEKMLFCGNCGKSLKL